MISPAASAPAPSDAQVTLPKAISSTSLEDSLLADLRVSDPVSEPESTSRSENITDTAILSAEQEDSASSHTTFHHQDSASPALDTGTSFFFVDTVGDSSSTLPRDEPTAAASLVQAGPLQQSPNDSDLSDTEDVYQPPGKQAKPGQSSLAGNKASDTDAHDNMRSARTFATVVEDPVACELIVPQVPPRPFPLQSASVERMTANNNGNKVSRASQKKRDKRDARERKKLRKKGQRVARLLHDVHLDASMDFADAFEAKGNDRWSDVPDGRNSSPRLSPRLPRLGRKNRAEQEHVLQDYLRNIQNSTDDDIHLHNHSFADSINSAHLTAEDLADDAETSAAADLFAHQVHLAAISEAGAGVNDIDSDECSDEGSDEGSNKDSDESSEDDHGVVDTATGVVIEVGDAEVKGPVGSLPSRLLSMSTHILAHSSFSWNPRARECGVTRQTVQKRSRMPRWVSAAPARTTGISRKPSILMFTPFRASEEGKWGQSST